MRPEFIRTDDAEIPRAADVAGEVRDAVRADGGGSGDETGGAGVATAERAHRAVRAAHAIAVLTDLKRSSGTTQVAKAASVNLQRVQSVGGGAAGSWLKWLVLIGGGVLFAVQFYVVMRAATVSRRRAALGGVKVALGIVAGLATAVVFAWAFFNPPGTPLWVLVALGVDLAVVALASWTPSAARRTPHSA
jgi:hypothetical protein